MTERNYIYKVIEVKQKYRKTRKERFQITSPKDFYNFAKSLIADSDREKLLVAGLNTKNEVLYFEEAHTGGLSSSVVDVRMIFKTALLNNAAAIIVAHNHPSGNSTMSNADIEVSKKLHYAGELINVEFLDHIVVTEENYSSFKEGGVSIELLDDEEMLERAVLNQIL